VLITDDAAPIADVQALREMGVDVHVV